MFVRSNFGALQSEPGQEWSKCSASCSRGFRSRSRLIEVCCTCPFISLPCRFVFLQVEANHCGLPVGGLREQFESCSSPSCASHLAAAVVYAKDAEDRFCRAANKKCITA